MKFHKNRFTPRLETLEDRIVPTWPFLVGGSQNVQQPILATYGQFQQGGGIHFHEGVDIIMTESTPVLAIEAGTIVGAYADALAYRSFVVVDAGGGNTLNYIHVVPSRVWTPGDTVNIGTQLGTVAAVPPALPGNQQLPAHLHLDRGGPQDYYWNLVSAIANANYPTQSSYLRTPISNPLSGVEAFLNPKVDDYDPVVNDIHFLVANHDRLAQATPLTRTDPRDPVLTFNETPRNDNLYFGTNNAQGQKIVGQRASTATFNNTMGAGNAQIDIVGEIWDQFGSNTNDVLNRNKLGVQQVWFMIDGPNATTGLVNSFNFSGVFLDDGHRPDVQAGTDIPSNSYYAFRNSNLVRTVYANDATSPSTQGGSSWYIVTNTDSTTETTNTVVDNNDRNKFWNSKAATGFRWNSNVSTEGNCFVAFPDDIYTVTVAAIDASHRYGTKEVQILLDNWEQTVTTTAAQYNTNQNVIVSGGEGYRRNQFVDIYAVPLAAGATPADGITLPVGQIRAYRLETTEEGNIPDDVNLGMLPAGRYAIIVDYNQDGTFTNRLDAYRIINVVAPPQAGNGPINQVPGAQAFNEDMALVFSVANGNALSVSDSAVGTNPVQVTLAATNGTLTLAGTSGLTFANGTGSGDASVTFTGTLTDVNTALNGLTFTPGSHYYGTASVEIFTDDLANNGSGDALTDDQFVDLTVNPVAYLPTANDDSYTGPENGLMIGYVLNNDTDVANKVLTVTSVNGTTDFLNGPVSLSLGTLRIYPDGYFEFQPNANAYGSVTFTYALSDGNGGTSSATVTLTVNHVNQSPTGADHTVTTLENTAYTFTVGDFNFSDPNDTPPDNFQAVEITTLPSAGTLTNNGTAVSAGDFISVSDLNAGHLMFMPPANGSAPIAFTFCVQDDGISSNGGSTTDATPRTMTIHTAPTFTSASSTAFTVGSAGTFTPTTSGYPAPTFSEMGQLPGGVVFSGGVFTGTPNPGTGGSYYLSLTADNGTGATATQSFTLFINEAPAFTNGSSTAFVVGDGGSFTLTTTGFPNATLSAGTLPSWLTLTDNGNGSATLSGTPAPGSGGSHALTLAASNAFGSAPSQSFTLEVDEPPAFTSAASGPFLQGTAGAFTVTTSGFPFATLTAAGALPGDLTFTDNGDGTATFSGTPAANNLGNYSVPLSASNGFGGTVTQTFTLSVNKAPYFASAASATFGEGDTSGFGVWVPGWPYPVITATGTLPAGVTFWDIGDGAAIFFGTPAAGSAGVYTITLTAGNGIGGSVTQTFTLTVAHVNHAPVAYDYSYSMAYYQVPNSPFPSVLGNATDADGDPLTAILVSGPSHGWVYLNSDGTFIIGFEWGYVGTDSFTFSISDGSATSNIATVTFILTL